MDYRHELSLPAISIIKASAGAGKTFELAINFLKTLHISAPNPSHLRRIMAITFTNKAALEMKERILLFLKNIAINTDLGIQLSEISGIKREDAIKWIDILLDNYTDFNVKTIDSLLFTIFKGLCFELNMNPELDVIFSLDEIIDEAFDLLLKDLVENEYMKFEEMLTTYLKIEQNRGFYPEKGIKRRFLELYSHAAYKSIKPVELEVDQYYILKQKVSKSYRDFYSWYKKLEPHLNKSRLRSLTPEIPEEDIVYRKFWQYNFEDLFKKNEMSKVDENDLNEFKGVFSCLKKNVHDFSILLGKFAYYQAVGYTHALNKLSEYVDKVCRRDGVTLLSTWIEHIKKQIKEDGCLPLIYAYLGDRISYFLFDEFQDTSRQQWEALFPLLEEALSRGGAIFVVGDVKQAIYRWRGGDWTLFNDIKQAFYVDEIHENTLPYNYRSHPHIVDFISRLFSPLWDYEWVRDVFSYKVLGKEKSIYVREQFSETLFNGYKDVKQIPKGSSDKDAIISLFRITGDLEEVKGYLKKHVTENVVKLWDLICERSGIESVAILVRSNEQAKEVSGWLIEKNIPVITENSLNLWTSKVIRGIYCLLRLIIDPRDTASLYGVLLSGIVEGQVFEEDELISICVGDKYEDFTLNIHDILAELKRYVTYVSCYELLMIIAKLLNLEKRLYFGDLNKHCVFWEKLLEVTYEVEAESRLCLEDYLDFLHTGGLDSQIGIPEDSRAIQVMTIHKAKGLEFDYVFIPYTDWYLDTKGPIIVKDSELISLCKKAELYLDDVKMMRDQIVADNAIELINLFYVALSRAKKGIYLYLTDYSKRGGLLVSKWIECLIEKAGLKHRITDLM